MTGSSPASTAGNHRLPAHWAARALILWRHRRVLLRVTAISLVVGLAMAFLIPKQYKSSASIMPPEQGSSAMLLAALVGHSELGGLGSLASGLFGAHSSSALFENLLQSGAVRGRLIDRFDLLHVYRTHYRFRAAKRLAHATRISDDKKSGVITIEVEDTDPVRARDMAQAYLDELNRLVNRTSTSSARQERIFIEHRLHDVQGELEQAQLALSEFSSRNSTVDIKEQTRAMVDAGARIQGELLVEQSSLQSLRQLYGDGNVRVRETEARIASLQRDVQRMAGSSAPLSAGDKTTPPNEDGNGGLYPPLRQLPRLAVPYADLYRRVKVQETVYELLTQQYELARIQEAKDTPVVNVIDTPGIPEKKSFPPHLLITLAIAFLAFAVTTALILLREGWIGLADSDPRKVLAAEVVPVLRRRGRAMLFARKVPL